MARARPDAGKDESDELRFLRGLVQFQAGLSGTLVPDRVLAILVRDAPPLLGASSASVWLLDREGTPRLAAGEPLAPEAALCVPLTLARECLGELRIAGEGLAAGAARARAELVARAGTQALSNARAHEAAQRDSLTDLPQRGLVLASLESELGRAERYGHPFALLLLDVDDLKRLNDSAGHGAGDRALIEVARALERRARASDRVARYGGDEFAVLLPETGREGAEVYARDALRTLEQAEVPIAASVGIAIWPDDGASPEALIESADRALYASKASRRVGASRIRSEQS